MEIIIPIDSISNVKLSYPESLIETYQYTETEMAQKIKKDTIILEILSSYNLTKIEQKVVLFLWNHAKNFSNDMKIGYLILKYTDEYKKKYLPEYQ
jgi:hypothetical protein